MMKNLVKFFDILKQDSIWLFPTVLSWSNLIFLPHWNAWFIPSHTIVCVENTFDHMVITILYVFKC